MLKHGLFRAIGKTAEVVPLRVEAKDVLVQTDFAAVSFDTQLVQIEGRVIQSRMEDSQRVLMVRAGNVVFGAREELPPTGAKAITPEGSVVRLTGICSIITDDDRNPTSFSIVLRSDQDIVLLKDRPVVEPRSCLDSVPNAGRDDDDDRIVGDRPEEPGRASDPHDPGERDTLSASSGARCFDRAAEPVDAGGAPDRCAY